MFWNFVTFIWTENKLAFYKTRRYLQFCHDTKSFQQPVQECSLLNWNFLTFKRSDVLHTFFNWNRHTYFSCNYI